MSQAKDTFVKSNSLYIVMEYADGGDLASLIRKQKDDEQPFTETHAMTIFSQCLLALQYIHSKHILHRFLAEMLEKLHYIRRFLASMIFVLPTVAFLLVFVILR